MLKALPGCIAWKDPAQAEAQKERLRQKRAFEREAARERERDFSANDVGQEDFIEPAGEMDLENAEETEFSQGPSMLFM